MNMNNLKKPISFALAVLTVGAAQVQAQTAVFSDDFSTGNAADNGYYRFGTAGTTLNTDNTSGTLDYTYSVDAANRSGVIKQFTNTTLALGETLIFAFTIDGRTFRDDENNSFRWSIGNIGTAINGDLTSAEPFSSGTRRNYVFAAATGVAATAFNHHSAGFASPVNGGTTTDLTGLSASSFDANSVDSFSIMVSFTRTATGVDIEKDFGGTVSYGSFATSTAADFDFNTLAFSMNNAGDYTLAVSDVSVSVIPEPSTYGMIGGVLVLGLALLHRRRK